MIKSVEIGVSDHERARSFYFDLLGLPQSDIELVEVSLDGDRRQHPPQRGLAHAGWVVESVDREAERLRTGGVRFAIEPRDGKAIDRVAFVCDPDGTQVELVQGHRHYGRVISEELASAERGRPRTPPALDHVAIEAASIDQTLAFYGERFGVRPIGETYLGGPTECLATFLDTGGVTLEIFTRVTPSSPAPGLQPREGLGMRCIYLASTDGEEDAVDPDGTRLHVRLPT